MPEYVLAPAQPGQGQQTPEDIAKAAIGDPQFLPEEENLKSNPPQDVSDQLPPMAGVGAGKPGMEQAAQAADAAGAAPVGPAPR